MSNDVVRRSREDKQDCGKLTSGRSGQTDYAADTQIVAINLLSNFREKVVYNVIVVAVANLLLSGRKEEISETHPLVPVRFDIGCRKNLKSMFFCNSNLLLKRMGTNGRVSGISFKRRMMEIPQSDLFVSFSHVYEPGVLSGPAGFGHLICTIHNYCTNAQIS